ncbi:MAG: TIM barrel protein [Nitrospirae bacterium]|nr:TIM barrel protein [Nitrospirota bacterium]
MKFGLKLWSTNANYKKEAIRLYEQGIYHYIELYAVPGTYDTHINLWKDIGISFVIHAPHFRDGLNLAKKENKNRNILLIKETQEFADMLKADKMVVHPGIAGRKEEAVAQLNEINDVRILVENKPYYALDDGLICNGATFEEMQYILDNTKLGFCLDIGHAFCAARGLGEEPMDFLKKFLNLKPEMFHLTDGDYQSEYDRHDHIGKGNFDIKSLLKLIPQGKRVTVETIKDSEKSLTDFEEDIACLKEFCDLQSRFH